jgi:hypothetical protein
MKYMEEQRLTVIGVLLLYLPKPDALNIWALWRKWEKEHGPLWLVGRLKLMQQTLVNPDLLDVAKIAHKKGVWIGPMKAISILASKGRAGLRDACRCLRLTGVMEEGKITEEQYIDHFQNIGDVIPPQLPPHAYRGGTRRSKTSESLSKQSPEKGF